MKTIYFLFEAFVKVVEFLEDNYYDYKWKQIPNGYEIEIKY